MKLKELKEEVTALGYGEDGVTDGAFCRFLNRATARMAAEYPLRARVRLVFPPVLYRELASLAVHTPGAPLSYTLTGLAYSLTVTGEGTVTVFDGERTKKLLLPEGTSTLRGYLHGEGHLLSSGETPFAISRLIVFDRLCVPSEKDIPLAGEGGVRDMKKICPDFLAFISEPTDISGKPIHGCTLSAAFIKMPESFSGEIAVDYRRAPREMTPEDAEEEIELPEPLISLLPLLMASEIYLDGEPERSQYFAALYRDGMERAKRSLRDFSPGEYRDVLGW